jgi:Ca-activated chloride channel family protein
VRSRCRFLVVGFLILSSLTLAAQQAVFRSSVDLIPVYATVTGRDGRFATGLPKDDFTVLDNGTPQEIVSFAEATHAISVSVILDTSSSMVEAMPRVFAAAGVFLDSLRPDDRAMVGSLLYKGPPFTSDKARLRSSMDLLPRDAGSPVWLALDRAVTSLQPETNRRVIVIYTDGRNGDLGQFRALKIDEASVQTRVEAAGVMVYVIGFEGISLGGAIKTIARRSGGRATELGRADDLSQALAAVADDLHHQYLLGFTPVVFDGQAHKIEVRMRQPNLIVRARESYVASRRVSGGQILLLAFCQLQWTIGGL